MVRAVPTTAQAERIHQLFDEVVERWPREAELLRGLERSVVQQPQDDGPGRPEPVEVLLEQVVAGVLAAGPRQKRRMGDALRRAHGRG